MQDAASLLKHAVLVLLLLALPQCASVNQAPTEPPSSERAAEAANTEELREAFRALIKESTRNEQEQRADLDATGQGRNTGFKKGEPNTSALLRDLRERIEADFRRSIERQLGIASPLKDETIPLEAIDEKGRVTEVSFTTQTRELRSLTSPAVSVKTRTLLSTDNIALDLYDQIPSEIAPAKAKVFMRAYTGDDARAIGMEAKLIVTLKGGAWAEPGTKERVANAVAVRGLDFDRGLVSNTNRTYDDSMYIIIEERGGVFEVYEFRMTTESSSSKRGVGRLDSKQVSYVRGLHKGRDPAYRLLGNSAQGTRRGLEGEYQIVGANIHSSYSRWPIHSDTPLSPNVSLGCQVVAASKKDFEGALVVLLDKKGIRTFPYTIVDGKELAFLNDLLREQEKASVLVAGVPRHQDHAGLAGG